MATFNPDYVSSVPEYTEDYPFSEIIFPEDVPLCAKDLNEFQKNFGFQISTIAKNVFDTQGNGDISFVPFEREVNVTKGNGTYTYNVSLKGFLVTLNHIFKIDVTKSFTADTADSRIIYMAPSIITVDESTTDIKPVGTDNTLPNYLANNKFVEAITKREALSVSFGICVEADYDASAQIEVCKVAGTSITSDEIIIPKIAYDDFHEYVSIYNQPYLVSDTDREILKNTTNLSTISAYAMLEPETFGMGAAISPVIRVMWRGNIYIVGNKINDILTTYGNSTQGYINYEHIYLVASKETTGKSPFSLISDLDFTEDGDSVKLYSGAEMRQQYAVVYCFSGTVDNVTFDSCVPLFSEVPDSRAKRFYAAHSMLNGLSCVSGEISVIPDDGETLIQRTSTTYTIENEDGTSAEVEGHGIYISTRATDKAVVGLNIDSAGDISVQEASINDDYTITFDEPYYLAFKKDVPLIGQIIISFPSDSWVLDESTGMYTQSITIDNLLESDIIFTDVLLSSDTTAWDVQTEAYQYVKKIVSSDKKITAYCTNEAPTATFSVQLTAIRGNTNFLN